MPIALGDVVAPVTPVYKFRSMINSGQEDEAWEEVETYLNQHPDDVSARLLKAELCLDLQREISFVGKTLRELSSERDYKTEVASLQKRADKLAGDKLAEGRGRIERGYSRDAIEHFNTACDLLPADPSVPLSAALALLSDGDDIQNEIDNLIDLFSSRQSPAPGIRTNAIEKFLKWALERSAPEHTAHTEAARRLVHFWLAHHQIDLALDWLEATPGQAGVEERLSTVVYEHAAAAALNTAANLLRNERVKAAKSILRACRQVLPDAALIHLLTAEVWLISGRQDRAISAYRRTLKSTNGIPKIASPVAARCAWEMARSQELSCAQCGKVVEAFIQACPLCDTPIKQRDLMLDRWRVGDASAAFLAHVGLAQLLADQGELTSARSHLEQAISMQDSGKDAEPVKSNLRELRIELEQRCTRTEQLDWQFLKSSSGVALSAEVLAQIRQICDTQAERWQTVPLKNRLSLGRRLLRERQLSLARDFLESAFTDRTDSKTWRSLCASLGQAIDLEVEGLLKGARQALDNAQFENALHLAGEALNLCPQDHHALLIRGEARLGIGHDLAAIADFHAVLTHSTSSALIRSASLASARSMERRRDIENALAILEHLDGDDAAEIRERLGRLKRGEPAVKIDWSNQEVMYDTLARSAASICHGTFAVAVRSVGRPWKGTLNEWTDQTLKAMFEFVQVLGGLRHVVGTPMFALRLISQPYAPIPERGNLEVALLVRVSAESQEVCQRRALDVWSTLRSLLPAQQYYVYHFEPVVDFAELDELLVPFEPTGSAEIVRRETAAGQAGGSYTVYPFVPGTPDLNNLCWTLLRQPAAAMVSIHLLPTELMAWERTTFDRIMQDETVPVAERFPDADALKLVDPVSQWWRGMPRWNQAHASRRLVDSMPSQAYLLAVNVVTSGATDGLLPEAAASALFGPSNPASDARYGGYEVVRAGSSEEFQIACHNLARLEMERWVYTLAPDRLNRLRYLMSESEAVCAFRLPVPGRDGLPGVPMLDARPVPPPAGLPDNGIVLGASLTGAAGAPLRITQGIEDRRRHTYIVGKTGVGKTTLLETMALQDIEAGYGVCVVDPHGDLIEELLLRIPAHRADDVILFDPSDDERPIGLNLLAADSESQKAQIVNEFIGLLIRMYDPHNQGIVGPRFQHNVRNAMLTVMSVEGSTLIEVVRVLTDPSFVRSMLPFVKDPMVRTYWEKQIASTSDFHKSEILDYIVSKFSRFVGDQRVRHIVGQKRTTLNFRQIMDRQQILLVNLSKGKIGSENAQFLGLLLVQQLLITALSRANLPTAERRDFFLYVDEFQNFATDLFATMLSEGRKYGVALVVANQYLNQLDHSIRDAIFGNAGSLVSFRLGIQDTTVMAPEMYPSFGPDDLINLPKYTASVKLLVDGVASTPFTLRTLPDLRLPDPARAEAIRQHSRRRYGADVADIAGEIATRFHG